MTWRCELTTSIDSLIHESKQNASYKDILAVAPHLDANEAAELLSRTRTEITVDFIGPPVLIRGAEHCYRLIRHKDGRVTLSYHCTHRRHESYCMFPDWASRPRPVFMADPYRERVANFAESQYGDHLQWDKTVACIEFAIDGEFDFRCMVGFSKAWSTMRASTMHPVLQCLENYCTAITQSWPASFELQAGNVVMVIRHCPLCGGGNGSGICHFCGHELRTQMAQAYDDPVAFKLPFPLFVHNRLTAPHVFVHDLKNAVKSHYAEWAADGFTAPTRATAERSRSILLKDLS